MLRVIKKVVSLYGPRKYLIEGFPRDRADLYELNRLADNHSDLEVFGYIQLEME